MRKAKALGKAKLYTVLNEMLEEIHPNDHDAFMAIAKLQGIL